MTTSQPFWASILGRMANVAFCQYNYGRIPTRRDYEAAAIDTMEVMEHQDDAEELAINLLLKHRGLENQCDQFIKSLRRQGLVSEPITKRRTP